MEKIKLFILQNKTKTIIFMFLSFVCLILLISIIILATRKPNRVILSNFDELNTTATNHDKERIEQSLWTIIQTTIPQEEIEKLSTIDAIIRLDTYMEKQWEDNNFIYSGNFYVDIDSIKQTYIVSWDWSSKKKLDWDVFISCPTIQTTKYPESHCVGIEDEGPIDEYMTYEFNLKNQHQLKHSLNIASANIITHHIKSVILDRADIETAPEKNISEDKTLYQATIEEASFKKITDSDPTYNFNITASDNRIYNVYVRTDKAYGDGYIATVIQRIDKKQPPLLYIYINDEADKSYEYLHISKDDLINWANSLQLGEVKLKDTKTVD